MIVQSGGYLSDRQGMLLGVEIGECLPAEQDTLQNLLTNFSFQDASLGVVSLVLSAIYFGHYGHDHVNILTLLAVGIVAGLNQEVREWPMKCAFAMGCTITRGSGIPGIVQDGLECSARITSVQSNRKQVTPYV